MGETLRDGRFVVLGSLGRGSQGQTFDGADLREGRAVAIKRFDVGGARSWKDVELAEREARVLQAVSHEKLPGYIDHFENEGSLYLVMEKIEGESLASLHARGVVLDEQDVVGLLTDASEVLDYLRTRDPPVIHRDLKPGNVIRRPDGSFAFVDFGAVRDKLRPRGGSTVVGTFGYMAPEQFQGRAQPASDVYAIGATAVAMLTGREPEDLPHEGLAIDVRTALRGRPRPALVGVLERMLAPDPQERADRIAPLLAELKAGHRRPGPGPQEWRMGSWDLVGHKHLQRAIRHEQRRAVRRARREARRHAQALRAPWGSAHVIPRPLSFALAIVFAIAMVAVTLATRVVVPIVLQLLALFVAPSALRNAAASVRSAGGAAITSLGEGQRALLGGGPVRVADDVHAAAGRPPVEPPSAPEDPLDEPFERGSASAKR